MVPAGVDGSGRLRFVLSSSAAPGVASGMRGIPVHAIDDVARAANGTLWLSVEVCCLADLDNDGVHANGGAPDGGVDINDLLFFQRGRIGARARIYINTQLIHIKRIIVVFAEFDLPFLGQHLLNRCNVPLLLD